MIPGSRAVGTPSTRTSQAGEEFQREIPMGPWLLFQLGAQKKNRGSLGSGFFLGTKEARERNLEKVRKPSFVMQGLER